MPSLPPPTNLHRDALGNLVLLDADGRMHVDVRPVRMFPFSEPSRAIAVIDLQGREVATIGDLASLEAKQRELVLEELQQREFVPVIERVVSVSSDTEPCEWQVETDRGATSFVLKSEDDIRRLAPHHYLIADALGMRYLIPDTRKLDAFSRRVMEKYS